ncbi:MAG: aminoglycoside phosphotransferase family protein [Anaerolineae bacterium]|nr:aminoglycoside phosphotransferase family protein [Anaerolineae bacterium]
MKFTPLNPQAIETPFTLTANKLMTMCRRAFGESVRIVDAREVVGGTFNETWLVTLPERQVILRIAPPAALAQNWDDKWLMRRENQVKPYFAAVALYMPQTLLADFTHQILHRDYLFQTFMPGERWDSVADQFTRKQSLGLWKQFGALTRQVHDTSGTLFGGPFPARSFVTWSLAILYRLESVAQSMTNAEIDTAAFQTVIDLARAHTELLDEYRSPRLLHGDLWLFNILVDSRALKPTITAILDADRCWWGDPMADWTMFVLSKTVAPEMQSFVDAFWGAYGKLEHDRAARFRNRVYQAMHTGAALVWADRQKDVKAVADGVRELQVIADTLPDL